MLLPVGVSRYCRRVPERHPREQGLKHRAEGADPDPDHGSRATSTRTRIETCLPRYGADHGPTSSRATSTRTRIETPRQCSEHTPIWTKCSRATSTRTRIETRKLAQHPEYLPMVPERHPREQGLKHSNTDTLIETLQGSRATSTRTRIETQRSHIGGNRTWWFQSDIHENKD